MFLVSLKKKDCSDEMSDLNMHINLLFQVLFNEYELILQMLLPFFKNYGELDLTMKNLIAKYRQGATPNDLVRLRKYY